MKNNIFLILCLLFANAWAVSYKELNDSFQEARVGCSQNDGEACYRLGKFYELPYRYEASGGNYVKFMQTDCVKAIENYEKSCGLDNYLGCAGMGYVYEQGGCYEAEGYVPRDLYKAKAYFSKSCRLSNYTFEQACIQRDTLERLGIR